MGARIMMKLSRLLLVVGVLFAGAVNAQVYNRFGPANGILKGDTATYQTTAAAASDVISLWSGTCNATTFFRGDGACSNTLTGPITATALNGASLTSAAALGLTATGANAITLTTNSTSRLTVASDGGIVAGTATGGSQGAGTINAGALYVNGVAVSAGGGASLSANNTWTGTNTFYPAVSGVTSWCRSTATVGQKCTALEIDGSGSWFLFPANDSGAAVGSPFFGVARNSATSISSMAFGNSTDNPSYTFSGTGALSFTGIPTFSQAASSRIAIDDAGGATNTSVRFYDAGVQRAQIGAASAASGCLSGDAQGDLCLNASGAINFAPGGSGSPVYSIGSNGALTSNGGAAFGGPVTGSSTGVDAALLTKGTTTGGGNVSYVSFVDSSNVQTGAVGDYSNADNDIYIVNSTSAANINLTTTGGGIVQINGNPAAAFAWGRANSSGTFLAGSANVSGTSRTSTGLFTISLSSPMSVCTAQAQGATTAFSQISTTAAGPYTSLQFAFYAPGGGLVDPNNWVFTCFK